MDKSLGTNLHLWRFFTRAKQTVTRELSTPVQPLAHPSPLECWKRVHAISTLYWGVGEAAYFATDNSAFLKLRFKNTYN